MTKTTSVIIANYNHGAMIGPVLQALTKTQPQPEVIVVDDCSTDNSIAEIKKFPFRLIENTHNLGPTKSRNLGTSFASCDYLLFLDSDIVLSLDYISKLTDFIETHEQIGIVTGQIHRPPGVHFNYTFGYEPDFRDYFYASFDLTARKLFVNFPKIIHQIDRYSRTYTLNYAPQTTQPADWVIEQAFMIPRELFNSIGGFDERFRMYFEGPDLCRRVRELGFQVYFFDGATAQDLGKHTYDFPVFNLMLLMRHLQYAKKYFHQPNPKTHLQRSAWFY